MMDEGGKSRGRAERSAAENEVAETAGGAAEHSRPVDGDAVTERLDSPASEPVTEPLAPAGDGGATAPSAAGAKPSRLRRWLVLLLVILASLGVVGSTVGVWAHRLLFNTDQWVQTVGPLGKDPEVTKAVGDYLGNQIVSGLQIETRLQDALPPEAQVLALPITETVDKIVTREITDFLRTDTAYELWLAVNRRAHAFFIDLLRGETENVTIQGDEVNLNLLPLISQILTRIDQRLPEALGSQFTPPVISPDTPADEANQQLSQALGIQLPPDFGQVTLFQSDKLTQLQDAVAIFDRVVVLIVVITVGLIAASLVLSQRRRRTAAQLGAGALLALLIGRLATERLEEAFVDSLKPGAGGEVARAGVTAAINNLRDATTVLLVVSVIVVVAAYLAGRPGWFMALLGRLTPIVQGGRGSRWAAAHLDGLRLAGILVAIVVLFLTSLSWWVVILVAVLLALYELGVSVLAGWRPLTGGASERLRS